MEQTASNKEERKEKEFVHLHVHTEYSLLDGATRIGKLFSACDEMNMPAVAITDHGNMYGVLEFVKAAVKHTDPQADFYEFMAEKRPYKVKPIIGCELYMCEDMAVKTSRDGKMPKYNHLVLLAKNETGYKNLIKLVSRSYTEGLYYKPRIDMPLLRQYTEGLVCLSACVAGAIPQAILAGDLNKADALVKEFKSLFGEDFYIEIQDHNIKDQKVVLPHLIGLARENGVKIVATNDVHYLTRADATMQKVLQCISFRTTMVYNEDEVRQDAGDAVTDEGITDDGYFPTKEFYLKSYDEMLSLFPSLPESLEVTKEIADKCDGCYYFRKEPLLPSYYPEDGSEPYEFLRKLTYDGLTRKYKTITEEIEKRAEYELGVIHRLGFVDYFLIVWDFIHWSETHDVPVGPGRGSGVGSIVAYAIGITKVNPLKYQLIFERFLNSERVSNPDFDIDFCVDKRELVIQYVTEKYGAPNVSQIVTFGTMAAKQAVKDVGRVYNYPYSEVEKITKLIPGMMGKKHLTHILGFQKWKDNEPSPVIGELRDMYDNNEMARVILDMAMKIEGMPRQTGMHAAGVIICRDPISDHVPMAKTGDGNITTEFNMIECEELGLLKMDFLGLRTLTDIKKAVDIVKVTQGVNLDFYDMEYNDEGVFKLIGDGDTHAVFQLESEGMKKFMRDLKPSSLEDIIAGISLYRPGPMDKIDEYVFNKKNPDKIKYDHPLTKPILEVSYGIMVYQEQVMQMVQALGGYTLGRADNVRRMMSKKKVDAMEKEREVFVHGTVDHGVEIPGCIKNGVPEDVANKIYDDMIAFASYAFNKSHAAAYAYLAYQTAYLKCYYPVEFITAVLNNRITSIDEITNYLTYLKERNVTVLPPSINKSFVEFTVENGAVRIGLAAIKNVGKGVIEEIIKEREKGGEFKDFVQFVKRIENAQLNKRMLESLIYAGAFDCLGKTRSQYIAVYETVIDRVNKDRAARLKGQFSFFDMSDDCAKLDEFEYPAMREYPLGVKLAKEKEVAGVYLTGHPLEEYTGHLKKYNYNSANIKPAWGDDGELTGLKDDTVVKLGGMLVEAEKKFTKSGKELGIGKLEDLYGTVDLMLTGYTYKKLKNVFQKDGMVTVTGKIKNREDSVTVWVDSIELWGDVKPEAPPKMICFYLSFGNSDPSVMDNLQDILSAYPGRDETYCKNLDDGKLYPLGIGVEVSDSLVSEARGLMGSENVKIAVKK